VKKFRFVFVVFAAVALLSLEMISCFSIPKLDLSTLDPSQPVQVGGIYLFAFSSSQGLDSTKFYEKYGESLRDEQIQPADANTLLEILCGTTAANWESIVERVKAETGLLLSGDQFMMDLESGNSYRIVSQKENIGFGGARYSYSWNILDQESPSALIGLIFDSSSGIVVPNKIQIQTAEWDEFGTVGNVRDHTLQLR
jgi:hypothetical protein